MEKTSLQSTSSASQQRTSRGRNDSTLQYLPKNSSMPKDVPLAAFNIENTHLFDSNVSLNTHVVSDGVSETGIVSFPAKAKSSRAPEDILPMGANPAIDYERLHRLLLDLNKSTTNLTAFRKQMYAIAQACRLVSNTHEIDPSVNNHEGRRCLGIQLFLLLALYFGFPALWIFCFPMQYPMYMTDGKTMPVSKTGSACAAGYARRQVEVRASGTPEMLWISLCILSAQLAFYVIYRCCLQPSRKAPLTGFCYVLSMALLTTFSVLFTFYMNSYTAQVPMFTLRRISLFLVLFTLSLSCLLLALRGWTGDLNYLAPTALAFNAGHNLAILLASILSLLFYFEITERKRPCGLGRPLNDKVLREILEIFSIVAAVTVLTSFLVAREVQMFLKGRRAVITKDGAALEGATILTWSFLYPAYFSRVCCRSSRRCCNEGEPKGHQVAPQALPSAYSRFAAETDVTYGTAGLMEKRADAAKQKAEEARVMADAAKQLAAEAEDLAKEAKGIADSDDVINVPGFCE